MKYLLVLLVVVIGLWIWSARRRKPAAPPQQAKRGHAKAAPTTMLACSHCGVHLPQTDALNDSAGRPYCSEAHRLAGPR